MQIQAQQSTVTPVLAVARPLLKKNMATITELCKKNRVRHLWAFGSVTTDKFKRNSDIDFLVELEEMDPFDYGEAYFAVCFGLEDMFNRKIDLVTVKSLNNPYFIKSVMAGRQLIYG